MGGKAKKLRITAASEAADLLWPQFEDRAGVIVLAGTRAFDVSRHHSKSDEEAFCRHRHPLDCFEHGRGYVTDPEFDVTVPEPRRLFGSETRPSWSVSSGGGESCEATAGGRP